MTDYTGNRFGKLTAISFIEMNKSAHQVWKLKCDCGNIVTKTIPSLKVLAKRGLEGKPNCGCDNSRSKRPIKNIQNKIFGSLTALSFDHKDSKGNMWWKYRCVCRSESIKRSNIVQYEHNKHNDGIFPSCGCKELEQKTKHGYRTKHNTHPLYRAYRSIMDRCYNPSGQMYKWYGAKGVTISDEWKNNPIAFIEWGLSNGWEDGLEIDKDILCERLKIEPKIYSKDTCMFVTKLLNSAYSAYKTNNPNRKNIKISVEEEEKIKEMYQNDISIDDIHKQFNQVARETIYVIATGKRELYVEKYKERRQQK